MLLYGHRKEICKRKELEMKKIGVLLIVLTILATSLLSLTSCSGGSDIPDDMQLVSGGENLGFYFYAPEEWTVSNVMGIYSAYASRVDRSSVSFAEVNIRDLIPDGRSADDYFFNSYFADSLKEYKNAPTVSKPEGETVFFGKEGEAADAAKKYTFTFEYNQNNKLTTYGCMQILIKKADRYFVFQYTASLEKRSGTDTSYYDYYLGTDEDSKLAMVMNEFRFVNKVESEEEKIEYEKDSDGYILISDSELSNFDLFVPESYKVDYSSAIVSATHADGTNINMTVTEGTNENVNTYMRNKLIRLSQIVENVEYGYQYDENGEQMFEDEEKKIPVIKYESIDFAGALRSYAYEYTYTYNGEEYYVYQVIAIDGWIMRYKGYVFTYVTSVQNYEAHKDELQKILAKVDFE